MVQNKETSTAFGSAAQLWECPRSCGGQCPKVGSEYGHECCLGVSQCGSCGPKEVIPICSRSDWIERCSRWLCEGRTFVFSQHSRQFLFSSSVHSLSPKKRNKKIGLRRLLKGKFLRMVAGAIFRGLELTIPQKHSARKQNTQPDCRKRPFCSWVAHLSLVEDSDGQQMSTKIVSTQMGIVLPRRRAAMTRAVLVNFPPLF